MKITSAVNEAHATPRWLPSENSARLSNCPNQTSGIMKQANINAEYAAASGLSLIVGSVRKKLPEPFSSRVPLTRTIAKKPRDIEIPGAALVVKRVLLRERERGREREREGGREREKGTQ